MLDFMQQVIFEFLILIVNGILLALAIIDQVNGRTYTGTIKEKLSSGIFMLNVTASFLPWIFIIPRWIMSGYEIKKWISEHRTRPMANSVSPDLRVINICHREGLSQANKKMPDESLDNSRFELVARENRFKHYDSINANIDEKAEELSKERRSRVRRVALEDFSESKVAQSYELTKVAEKQDDKADFGVNTRMRGFVGKLNMKRLNLEEK